MTGQRGKRSGESESRWQCSPGRGGQPSRLGRRGNSGRGAVRPGQHRGKSHGPWAARSELLALPVAPWRGGCWHRRPKSGGDSAECGAAVKIRNICLTPRPHSTDTAATACRVPNRAALWCACWHPLRPCTGLEAEMWSFGGVPYHTAAWNDRAVASRRVLPGTAAARALRDRSALGAAMRKRLRPEGEPMIVDEFDCEADWQLPVRRAAAHYSFPAEQSRGRAARCAWHNARCALPTHPVDLTFKFCCLLIVAVDLPSSRSN